MMPRTPGKIYEGSARSWRLRPPEERDEGEELLLRHAILDAYTTARENGDASGQFRVVSIIIEGSNPPSDYKVGVVPHP